MSQDELIKILKEHQKSREISQEELATRLGVRVATVNRWFTGKITKMHKLTEKSVRSYLRRSGAVL